MKEAGILVGNLKETNLGVAQPFLTTNSDHFKLRPKSEIYIPKRDDEPLSYGCLPPPPPRHLIDIAMTLEPTA